MLIQNIPIAQVVLPTHLHRLTLDPDALRALADSIRDDGLLSPIIVEPAGEHFILRAGHRRLEACKLLSHDTIPANVRDERHHSNGEVITWAENFQRQDLTPMEEAHALERIVNTHHLDPATLAASYHCSEDWIVGRIALLELQPELQEHLHKGNLAIGAARALARVTDDAHRAYLITYTLHAGANANVVRSWVDDWERHQAGGFDTPAPRPAMPDINDDATITMPCACCRTAWAFDQLRHLRLCPPCANELTTAQLQAVAPSGRTQNELVGATPLASHPR